MVLIFLGFRKPQKLHSTLVVTLPSTWVSNFYGKRLTKLKFFTNEKLDLIIKVPIDENSEEKDIEDSFPPGNEIMNPQTTYKIGDQLYYGNSI